MVVKAEDPSASIYDINKLLNTSISALPDSSYRRAFKKYQKILGLDSYYNDYDVEGKNKGLSKYFEKNFKEKQCLRKLLVGFYSEIKKVDERGESRKAKGMGGPSEMAAVKISLGEEAGEGDFDNLKPGWVWELAMKHTKNDSELAMELVATCGHDDIYQGEFRYENMSKQALGDKKKRVRDFENLIVEMKALLSKSSEKSRSLKLLRMIEKTTLHLEHAKKETPFSDMKCPSRKSKYFLSKSLGQEADIADDLKNKIATIQSPSKGPSYLSSKYYHVYASAYLTCQLIREGVDPEEAVFIQEQVARGYRGVRMCSMVNLKINEKKDYLKDYLDFKNENKKRKSFRKTKSKKRKFKTREEEFSGVERFYLDKTLELIKRKECKTNEDEMKTHHSGSFCRKLRRLIKLPVNESLSRLTKDQLKDRIYRGFSELNAAELYRRWYLGGKTLGLNMPCSDFRLFGPESLGKSEKKIKFRGGSSARCVKNFSLESCELAKKKLNTWDLDFEWTIAQHRAGAKFASKKCRKNSSKKSLNERACELQKSKEKPKLKVN